jgi:hypothetical protein
MAGSAINKVKLPLRSLATLNKLRYIEYVFENDIEFNQAAFRHGISKTDIRHAVRHFIFEEQIDDGDDKHLILGFDTSRRLLEIKLLMNILLIYFMQ